jgi:DNA replication protein DnaC
MKAADQMALEAALKDLKLPTIKRLYGEAARHAQSSGASYEAYLLELVSREQEQRLANQLQRRLREAGFPQMKTLETTDLAKWPGFDARKVKQLAGGEYLTKKENLIFIGKHGTGKTHAALAFGIEACRLGRRVRFTTAAVLVQQLIADSGPIRPVNLVLFRPRFWFIPAGIPMAFRPKLGLDRNPGRNDSSGWPE